MKPSQGKLDPPNAHGHGHCTTFLNHAPPFLYIKKNSPRYPPGIYLIPAGYEREGEKTFKRVNPNTPHQCSAWWKDEW